MGQYVFISYSSKDSGLVQKIAEIFDKHKIEYWKAPEQIPAGSNYAKEIPSAIRDCSVFLVILSKTAQTSIWVEKEVDTAVCNRKVIIPLQIDDEPMNDMYRFYLNNVQMISYREGKENAFEEVIDRIIGIFNGRADNDSTRIRSIPEELLSEAGHKKKKTNALRINRIPVECEYCGGEVSEESIGVYRCMSCGRENYDDFHKIRNYLDRVGPRPAMVIARSTGVPVRTIEYFFREEYLEIPKNVNIRVACEKCGAPIRTGVLCENCKRLAGIMTEKVNRGVWHSEVWKR